MTNKVTGEEFWLKGYLNKEYYDIFKSEYGNKLLPDDTHISREIICEVIYLYKVQELIKNQDNVHDIGSDLCIFKEELFMEIGGNEWSENLKTHGIDICGNPLKD